MDQGSMILTILMKISKISKSLALATPLAAVMIADAQAAAYLKIGDIKGESAAPGFENFIKISYVKIEIDATDAKGDASKIKFKNPQIRFPVEQASPSLMLACATGQPIPKATLILTKHTDDGKEVAYYKVTFSDLVVTSYSTTGSDERDTPTEEISLGYTEVEWTYFKVSQKDGTVSGTTTTGAITVPTE